MNKNKDICVCCVCSECFRSELTKKCKITGEDVSKYHMILSSPKTYPKRSK